MAKRYTIKELKAIHAQFEELLFEHGPRYLLVDKQLTSRRALLNALTENGVEKDSIIDVGTSAEAIAEAKKHDTDFIVFTELKLDDMDVTQLMKTVRELPDPERYRFILMTAEKSKQRITIALRSGMHGYIKKPIDAKEVAKLLERLNPEEPETDEENKEDKEGEKKEE